MHERRNTFWLYILASRPGGALYVGVTNDLSRRVWEHRQGRGGLHTRRYRIDRLGYYEAYPSVRDAIQRERNMKHWPRAWKCNLIVAVDPTWRDLSDELAGVVDPDRGCRDKPGHDAGEAVGQVRAAPLPV